MLKIRSDAIKTLAKTVARTKEKKPERFLAETESPEVVYFNRKLREAFGLFATPQNVPRPTKGRFAGAPAESDVKIPEIVIPENKNLATDQPKEERRRLAIPDEHTIKADEEQAEEAKKAEEERLRQEEEKKKAEEEKRREEEAARQAEEEQARQLAALEAERAKKAEEEQARRREEETKKAEEERRRQEQEKKIAEEKKRQEEEAARQTEEEQARQLAALEAERAKKAAEEQARRREEERKAEEERSRREEERKKTEEEKAANSLPVVLKKLIAKLEEKREAVARKAAEIPAQRVPLEQKRRILESKIAMIRKSELAMVEEKEREIETKAAAKKNELEKNSDPAKEKTLKQALWQIEDSRKEIEKQRWAAEDKINKIKADAESVDRQISEKNRQLEISEEEISRISGEGTLVRFAVEKIRAEEEILKIISEKELLMPALAAASDKKNDTEKKLARWTEQEAVISKQLDDIEGEEAGAKDAAQKREIEKKRWQAGNDLKNIVQEKWACEEKSAAAAASLRLVQEKIDSLDGKIESIQNKITAAEIKLEEKALPVRALRDTIRRLLEENSVSFNPKIISRIVQIGKAEEKANEESKAPDEKAKAENKTEAAETVPPQAENAAPDNGTAREEADKPIAVSEEKKSAPDIVLRAEKVLPKENATPALKSGLAGKEKELETPPIKTPPGKTEADKNKSVPNDTVPAINSAIRQNSGETKTPSKEEIAETTGRNGNIYREQVEAAPARNIRVFAQENSPKIVPTAEAEREMPNLVKNEPVRLNPSENEPETDRGNLAPNPENRWRQIKKTTLPGAATFAPPDVGTEESRAQMATERPAAKSKRNNLLARLLIIFAVIAVLGIILAVILIKNGGKTPAVVKSEPKPTMTTEKNLPEEPAAPAPIVTTLTTVTIYVDSPANIPSSISPYMRKKFDANGYHSLLIVDRGTGKKIGLKQFFSAYKLNAPSVFYNSIEDDCEFFIYANNGKNRIGFAAKITKNEMIEPAMSGWEGSIAKDTENFFRLLGRKTFAEDDVLRFADGGAAGTAYKVMQFSPAEDEFAIAWANYRQTYFIFSASNNSMAKIFNQLPK